MFRDRKLIILTTIIPDWNAWLDWIEVFQKMYRIIIDDDNLPNNKNKKLEIR